MQTYPLYDAKRYHDLTELLLDLPSKFGNRPLFLENEKGAAIGITAQEFIRMVVGVGMACQRRGVLPGRVAVIGESSVRWIASYFAVVCGGGVVVPIDRELPEDEIAHIIQESEAAAVFFSASLTDVMRRIRGQLPVVQYFIQLEHTQTEEFDSFEQLMQEESRPNTTEFLERNAGAHALAALLYTSGTTGKSKGVMLTQNNILSAEHGSRQLIDVQGRGMSVLPIHHSYEYTNSILHSMAKGCTLAISDRPRYFLRNLQLFRPDYIFLVPAYIEMIYKKIWAQARQEGTEEQLKQGIEERKRERLDGIDNSETYFASVYKVLGGRLRTIVSGGAPLAPRYIQAFGDLGILLLQGYGITECSPLVSVNRNHSYKDASVGLPISHNEVQIRQADEQGEGEVWVRGDNVMLGYYKNEKATQEVMDGDWFDTGDIGHLDDDGFLYITGRKKNLIVLSNGKNVYPEEVEGYLYRVDYIKEAVVRAAVVDGREEELLAEVVIDEQFASGKTQQQLMQRLRADVEQINHDLPLYKQVHQLKIRDRAFDKTTKQSIKRFTIQTRQEGENIK